MKQPPPFFDEERKPCGFSIGRLLTTLASSPLPLEGTGIYSLCLAARRIACKCTTESTNTIAPPS